MDPLTITITVIGLVIAGLGSWYTYLAYRRGKPLPLDESLPDKHSANSLLAKLLTFVWHYPENGGNHITWAVKESFVLRGRLEDAREEPGLGVAIVTTELALNVFGDKAQSRIDGCIAWALANLVSQPPHLLKGKKLDYRTSEEKTVPDFRHTLAFAIILARTGKLKARLSEYLRYALETQNPDGGWSPGEGRTVSEVFTVLYAVELLSLCGTDEKLPEEMRTIARVSRNRSTTWLLSACTESGLWQSGVLKQYVWDDIVTTAWVLHRLAPIRGIPSPGWCDGLARAASSMIIKASNPTTWKGTAELQRFRAEARVAAAVSIVLETTLLDAQPAESLAIYLSDWRRRAVEFASKIPDDGWDVATAVFALESLFSTSQMREEANEAGRRSAATGS